MKFEINTENGAREVELPASGSISIGRQSSCDIVLDGISVSRRHAVCDCRDGNVVIEDAGSRRGTFVNGVRISGPHRLKDGDALGIGEATLVFRAPVREAVPRRDFSRAS